MRPRYSLVILILFSILPLGACRRERKVVHEYRTFQKSYENCAPNKDNCTYLRLSYPFFTTAPTPAGLQAINQQVMNFIIAPTGEKKAADLEGFSQNFFADFQNFGQQFPKAPQVWTLDRNVEVIIEHGKILSLALKDSEYLGGAHPNSNDTLLSINPATGARFTLDDLLIPGYQEKLNALGEKKFREVRQIPAGQSLSDAGFTFEGGVFKLNDNFAAGANGLMFNFNPYEVAAYAMGPTEILIDYPSIKDLIRPKGPLGRWAKK